MYQTLYRKYRPKTFDEVVGQNVIIKTLKNEIEYNQLNHAYLFTGPRGTGKTSIAKILAKTINCTRLENGNACNECVNCTQINKKQSTDIIEIDAASNNGVDEIRELKSKVNLVPSNGKYKVYIIDEVHMLTIGAFNALLKTLEEPPEHIIFILATTDPHKIPTTILSRCQRFDFKKISIPNLFHRLQVVCEQENIVISEEALLEIARLSDGGMRDALSLLDQVVSFSENEVTIDDVHEINGTLSQAKMSEFIQNIFSQDLVSVLNFVDTLNNSGKNLIKLTEELIQFMRNVLLYMKAPEYMQEKNNNIELYKNISQEISFDKLLLAIKQINSGLSDMKLSNNPKLMLELLMIQLMDFSTPERKNKMFDEEKNNRVEEKNNVELNKIFDNSMKQKLQKNEMSGDTSVQKRENVIDDLDLNKKIEEIKQIRINNALSGFNKKEYLEVKQKMDDLVSLLIDPSCSKYVSMIFDATLKAYGNQYLIYVYDDKNLSDIFNYNLITLEKIINDFFSSNYKLISVDLKHWDQIKKEFNSKTKQYKMIKEPYDLKEVLKNIGNENSSDLIGSLFGNIVEYEEE